MNVVILDKLDQEVNVGDWIAYGVGRGDLSVALVIDVKESGTRPRWFRDYSGAWQSENIPAYKLRIKSPDNDKASLIDSWRGHFVKIPPLPEGAEFGKR